MSVELMNDTLVVLMLRWTVMVKDELQWGLGLLPQQGIILPAKQTHASMLKSVKSTSYNFNVDSLCCIRSPGGWVKIRKGKRKLRLPYTIWVDVVKMLPNLSRKLSNLRRPWSKGTS